MTKTFDLRSKEEIEYLEAYAVECAKTFLPELNEKTGKASYDHWMKEYKSRLRTPFSAPDISSGGPLVVPGLNQEEIGKKIWIDAVDAYFANNPPE